MAIGFGGSLWTNAEEEWRQKLARLAAAKTATYNGPYQPATPAYNGPYQPAPSTPSTYNGPYQPAIQPTTQAYNGPYQPAVTGTSRNTGTATPVSTPVVTPTAEQNKPKTTPGSQDGKISNDLVTRKGQYYSGYPGTSIGALAQDVPSSMRAWAQHYKYGGDAYANYLSQLYPDPKNMMLAMGVNPSSMTDPQDLLDWQRRMLDLASGRHKIGGQYGYFSGRDMVSNILNAKQDNKAGSLGALLNDPTLLPDQQVKNTIGLLTTSLQSVISPDALQAYVSLLGRLGQQFIDARMRNPKAMGSSTTFNAFLRKQLGEGGGLY